ncbi:MAG: iron ABC transporter permease [Spirochaetales bacterium]|uniref:Iron ABC transporter permease n=1 Tax=Candidatus Thalassospirochaeta sargassi TaxID=3119039 RepID=A0AAJ1IC25_9SPIO|nr:iron ABC transporter permease [Spirochaetales bacterium]
MKPVRRRSAFYILIPTAPVILILISLCLGRYPIPVGDVIASLLNPFFGTAIDARTMAIINYIRLPRAILAVMVGGSLAVSGTAFQGLFRNPLVSSGMLGVSNGSGFGAALAIIIFGSTPLVYPISFLFGSLAVLFSYFVGRIYKTATNITLVLGGVIVGSLFSAGVSFLKYIADPYDQLPAIVFWLMGSLASARYKDILLAGIPMAAGSIGLFAVRYRINVLAMGEKEARTMGVDLRLTRIFVVACATLATAGAVCVSGVIGWVGLIIPHMGRMITGSDNRHLVPFSFSLGGCFLLIVDDISRLISGSELPLGILTAFIGAPFFIYLLKITKGKGWES